MGVEKKEPSYTVGENVNWYNQFTTPTMENGMEVPEKTKSRVTMRSSNPTPGHISGENHKSKRYMHPNVHCSIIYNNPDMEAT